ncbi:hypothetical protein FVEG_16926 [Fusarium verticillioides 7600]|uniref:Uncharacterized protein n=1 Tax=Gibberella moniliformis (strain M3125 / FGSC 7600) TaxID=334819 RepID=W7N664_GIBM7|nr:hypothetical protein FVEG_16926 [Fusarium verticillioides 7600]EWG52112.1 hypothetical protein FVEG_16926 [Fusarium verticillioides 7600]
MLTLEVSAVGSKLCRCPLIMSRSWAILVSLPGLKIGSSIEAPQSPRSMISNGPMVVFSILSSTGKQAGKAALVKPSPISSPSQGNNISYKRAIFSTSSVVTQPDVKVPKNIHLAQHAAVIEARNAELAIFPVDNVQGSSSCRLKTCIFQQDTFKVIKFVSISLGNDSVLGVMVTMIQCQVCRQVA